MKTFIIANQDGLVSVFRGYGLTDELISKSQRGLITIVDISDLTFLGPGHWIEMPNYPNFAG